MIFLIYFWGCLYLVLPLFSRTFIPYVSGPQPPGVVWCWAARVEAFRSSGFLLVFIFFFLVCFYFLFIYLIFFAFFIVNSVFLGLFLGVINKSSFLGYFCCCIYLLHLKGRSVKILLDINWSVAQKRLVPYVMYFSFSLCFFSLTEATDKSLLVKIKKQHQDNPYFKPSPHTEPTFVIQHFAGRVKYHIKVE